MAGSPYGVSVVSVLCLNGGVRQYILSCVNEDLQAISQSKN